jgi:hypothetical protein
MFSGGGVASVPRTQAGDQRQHIGEHQWRRRDLAHLGRDLAHLDGYMRRWLAHQKGSEADEYRVRRRSDGSRRDPVTRPSQLELALLPQTGRPARRE